MVSGQESIALVRASLNVERVRDYLAGKHRSVGYFFASSFGAITPFCSCSSIPVFLGFTSAGIPVGITMAFLLTSPLINEVAVLLLMSLLGWQFTLLYVGVGMTVGILGGLFIDSIRAERWLQSFAAQALEQGREKQLAEPQISSLDAPIAPQPSIPKQTLTFKAAMILQKLKCSIFLVAYGYG